MKTLIKGFLATLISLPFIAFSADSTETYSYALSKLKANPNNYNWLQERSIEGVDFASMVLCIIKQTGADLGSQVNKGPYLATVTKNGCDRNNTPSTATDGINTGTVYEYFVINSTSDGTDLDVKLWVPYNKDTNTDNNPDNNPKEIRAHFIFPLTRGGSDIGFSELYYTALPTDSNGKITSNTSMMYGFMKPEIIANGYKIIYAEKANWGGGQIENWVNLTRTGTGPDVALTGWTQNAIWSNSDGREMPATFTIAATKDELLRQQTFKGITTAPICFNRNSSKFNTWNYNLYDASTGLLVGANTNYQIRYGDYRGNYGSSNFWLPYDALKDIYSKSDKTANIVLEDGATTKNATVTVSNGGMWKVKKIETALSELADMTFSVWLNNPDGRDSRIYWDKTAQIFKNESDGTAVALPTWDTLWLNGPGVSYVLKAPKTSVTDSNGCTSSQVHWVGLTNTSKVIYRQETRVSEAELQSINGKTLNCVSNCPFWRTDSANSTSTEVFSVSAWDATKSINNKTFNSWGYYESGQAYQYTYNQTLRQLFNTDSSYSSSPIEIGGELQKTWNPGVNTKQIYSGPLVLDQDHPLISDVLAKSRCSWDTNYICGWEYENTLDEYYYWRSGEFHWDKQWIVKIDGVAPIASDPIMVKYTCPAGRTDCTPGSKVVLNYNGPGQLWGIPNRCVSADNYTVSVDCNDDIDKQWLNKFNLTTSPVNANSTTDRVTKISDSSKEYLILPQGSGEWYNIKGAGTAADCSVGLPTGTAQPINVDTYFKPSMVDIGNPPLDFKTTPVSIQNGVKLR